MFTLQDIRFLYLCNFLKNKNRFCGHSTFVLKTIDMLLVTNTQVLHNYTNLPAKIQQLSSTSSTTSDNNVYLHVKWHQKVWKLQAVSNTPNDNRIHTSCSKFSKTFSHRILISSQSTTNNFRTWKTVYFRQFDKNAKSSMVHDLKSTGRAKCTHQQLV